jgi:uncharacterized protein YkwD
MSFIRHPPRLLAALAAVLLVLLSAPLEAAFAQSAMPITHSASNRYGSLLAPAEACPGGGAGGMTADQKAAMRCLVNWARTHVGLRPLRRSAVLDRSSKLKASAIDRCHDFSHTACGRRFEWTFEQAGYLGAPRWEIGENIAVGTGPAASARSTLLAWLNSPGHRHNLLGAGWQDLGVGLARTHALLGLSGSATVWVSQFGWRG